MERPTTVIMLAGTIKPPPLRQELGLPVAALPIAPEETLLSRWLSVLGTLEAELDIRVVVNSDADAAILTHAFGTSGFPRSPRISTTSSVAPQNQVMMEESSWRGTAGIMRDMADDGSTGNDLILLIEASMIPPASLRPILMVVEPDLIGIIGATTDRVPNGIAAFRRDVLVHIPQVGYFDLKEQLLPRLHQNGQRVCPAWFEGKTFRIRDRRSYLNAVRAMNGEISPASDTGPRIEGTCLIDSTAEIADNAIVHDSVIMEGATIGPEAVVTRSVIGPGAVIDASQRVVREVIGSDRKVDRAAAHAGWRRRAS